MRLSFGRHCILFIFLCAAIPTRSYGQAGNGEITGEVRVSAKTVDVGAHVVLNEVTTNLSYETNTNEEGIYHYSHLKPGTYALAVGKSGFQRYEQEGITMRTGERIRADVTLAVGAVTTSVGSKKMSR